MEESKFEIIAFSKPYSYSSNEDPEENSIVMAAENFLKV